MSTSGDISWSLTRNELVASAYRKLGVPTDLITTTQYTDGYEALNAVMALMVTKGMALWKRTTLSFTPSATSQVYTVTGAVKLAQVYLSDSTAGSQYDLAEKSLYDFNRLPSGSEGVPVHYTFQPTIPNGGTLSIWPLTSDTATVANKVINAVFQKQFDGFVSSSDDLDFPAYWTLPIVLRVALALAPETGLPLPDRQAISGEYTEALKDCQGYSDEDGSFYIQPERRM